MKILLLIILSFAIFSVATAQPEIFINEDNFLDLDTVHPGIQDIQLQVKNLGDEPLVIESLGASCSCTSYHLENYTIAANDSSLLTVQFDLHRVTGERHNFLYFKSNDPVKSKLDFPINLFVYRDLAVTPKRLPGKFNIPANTDIEYVFHISNTGKKDIEIKTPLQPESDSFDIIDFKPEKSIIKKGERVKCMLKLNFHENAEMVVSSVKIPTSSEIHPILDMEFIASLKDRAKK